MKKTLLATLLLFFAISGIAQFTVAKIDGTPIANGEIVTFSSTVYSQAALALKITNTSASSIDVKLKCTSFTNTDGAGMEVCFGPNCFSGVTVGQTYPSASTNVTIATGGNDTTSHFANTDAGNGSSVIDYVFQIYMTNGFGAVIGTPFSFTYRYNPNLATNNFNLSQVGLNLKSNLVSSDLEFDVNNDSHFIMYDLNGRLIKENNLVTGYQKIDVSELNSGIYILNFTNSTNATATIKFIKQ